MNNPDPTHAQLRAEAAADRLLAEQSAVTAVFSAAIRTAIAAIEALEFPLGCPSAGFDLEDITATMSDFLILRDPRRLEYEADAAIRERAAV
ncbi:MAG: hypothetical protein ABSC06_39500 [Rhodopila sp.]